MKQYYNKSWTEVVEMMGTNIHKGLMEYDCTIRREEFGNNSISLPKKVNFKSIINNVINKNNIFIMVIALGAFILSKSYILLAIWSAFFVVNIVYKGYIYNKKYKEIATLQSINSTEVIVLREGVERIVEAHQLVKGDIVVLKKNSFIAADLRIITSNGLKVDEKNIIGEKYLKDKNELKVYNEVSSIGAISNMLFRGTIVRAGNGVAIVVETGNDTVLGNLMSSVRENTSKREVFTEAESQLAKLQIALIIVALIGYILLPGSKDIKIQGFANSIFFITTLFLPIIMYLYSKFISDDLLQDEIEINNVSALADSEEIKVLFVEKLGTIKESRLYVRSVFTNEKIFDANVVESKDINVRKLIDVACVNSDIYANNNEGLEEIYSNAYLDFIKMCKISKMDIVRRNLIKFRVPMDSDKGVFTTVTKAERGYRANVRGSLEEVISRCTHILINGVERPLLIEDIDRLKAADNAFARQGFITDSFAYRSFSYEPSKEENLESNLVFVGLVGLENPYLYGIQEKVDMLYNEGILPIIFCDDNKIAGETMGRKLGLIGYGNEVVSGIELSCMNKEEFYKAVSKARIYCKVTPKQKETIISTFIKDGYKVAVEGESLGELAVVASCNLGITKNNAPSIMKKLGAVYTNKSTIEGVLKLREKNIKQKQMLRFTAFTYIKIIMAMLFVTFTSFLINKEVVFSTLSLVLVNICILTPSLILSLEGENEDNDNKSWIYTLSYIVVGVSAFYVIKENREFTLYIVLAINILLDLLVQMNISFRSLNRPLILLIIAVLIMSIGGGILFMYLSISITNNLLISIGGFVLIYFILILMAKKWQG